MNFLKLREEKVDMEVLVNDCHKDKIEKDKNFKPKTSPQIPLNLYCKWLTDKYIKDTSHLKHTIEGLIIRLRDFENKIKQKDSNKFKYQNEKGEFLKEVYKEDIIVKLQKEINNRDNKIKALRKSIDDLVVENVKLKKQLENGNKPKKQLNIN